MQSIGKAGYGAVNVGAACAHSWTRAMIEYTVHALYIYYLYTYMENTQ